jgi:putative oxidoreductase
MNIALLILRAVVGGLFMGHGAQKLFGWFGGHGLEGTGGFMSSVGYRPGRRLALVAGLVEFGGGLLLALGFLTPLAAALFVGQMTAATLAVHLDNGLWNEKGGFEFPLVLAVVALVVAFAGPGTISVDNALGTEVSGTVPMVAALLAGVGAALFMDAVRRSNLAEGEPEAEARAETAEREGRRAA